VGIHRPVVVLSLSLPLSLSHLEALQKVLQEEDCEQSRDYLIYIYIVERMALEIPKIEAILRGIAILLLVSTACLVGLDSQTKFVIVYEKEVTYKDLHALV
jgi:hypothetical protein